jgi:glycosyltransferase involved in cell wall biosynthesis
LISIIIPALNEEKLISQTLSQFTPEIRKEFGLEIIVSDGGSTDTTIEKALPFTDKMIRASSEIKQNISVGRNTGEAAAEGKYLFFINADTRSKDTVLFLKTAVNAFSDPAVIALTCRFRIFPEEEKLTDKLFHTNYNLYVRLLNLIGMGMGRGECQMVKKDAFEKVGGYNESLAAGEDYDLYRRLRKLGRIKFLNDIIIYESPRRFREYGYFRVFMAWTRNSLLVLFRNRSASKEWKPVR